MCILGVSKVIINYSASLLSFRHVTSGFKDVLAFIFPNFAKGNKNKMAFVNRKAGH